MSIGTWFMQAWKEIRCLYRFVWNGIGGIFTTGGHPAAFRCRCRVPPRHEERGGRAFSSAWNRCDLLRDFDDL